MHIRTETSRIARLAGGAVILLLLISLVGAPPPTRGQEKQPSKRSLTHRDYDSWRSLTGSQISRNGEYVAYSLIPQDGDGELVIRKLSSGEEWRHPRGWRAPSPLPDDPEAAQAAIAALNRATRPVFSSDSQWLFFIIEPNKEDVLKARREMKKAEEMPANALGLLDLQSGRLRRIDRVKSFQVPEDGTGYIAILHENAGNGESGKANAKGNREYGTELVLHQLSTSQDQKFPEVVEYSLSKDARTLVFTVSARDETKNGVFAMSPEGEAGVAVAPLLAGRGRYSKISWDEEQTQLAFISDREEAGTSQPGFRLYHWRRTSTAATEIVTSTTSGFPSGQTISDKATLSFSRDGKRLFFGTARSTETEKEPATVPAEERVLADLWHWQDDFIQPMQKVRASQDRNRSYRAVWHLDQQRMTQLADETMETVNPSSNGLWAVGQDDRAYRRLVGVDTTYADVYLVNTIDGSRRRLLEKNQFPLSWSPGGRYAVFYDGRHWNSISIPDGKVTNLTANLKVHFWQEDHDTPNTPPPYGLAGWTSDDRELLIYDQYDIWQIRPDGTSATVLTDGVGRRDTLAFRYVRLDPDERWIDPARPLLLRAENQSTWETGFYRDRLAGGKPERLILSDRSFSTPVRAKNADVLMMTASRFDEFPDLHVTDSSFRKLRQVSSAGQQKSQFLWGRAELIKYRNTDGVELSGVLIKPDNFDPQRKYPLMVYIYEKLSDGLHRFVNPGPGTSINPSYYASNGYVVLMPDIVYRIGYPGASALNCVLPAVQRVVELGFIDEKGIGIQGHSWGGYQIAYMVTQTNRFKAAAPGAVVGNMTSAYSGIRWGTGLPRQFQYERTQSRIGGSLWEYPLRFIENSPIFNAHRVETPILMVHNDNDDAVPWYQGIEYFLALRRLNKEAYMFNYNGEYHGLRRRANQKDYTRRLQEFFDHHLRNAPKPAWMEKGVRWLDREEEKRSAGR
jgi:dipeptidyl aminopeptidase/acylaminoacyl peptidase